MILVLILLAIFISFLLISCLILASTFQIHLKDIFLSNLETKKRHSYEIRLSFHLFGKVKWLQLKLNSQRIHKLYRKMHLERIDIKKLEQDFRWDDLKILSKLHPIISYFNLQAKIGLQTPITTAFLVASSSSIISIILSHFVKKWNSQDYQYRIEPIFLSKNLYQIQWNCIIELKMVHIINVLYIFVKKGKSDKNESRTSNRKSYGYSYE